MADVFGKQDFDILRTTLAAHLAEVLPERDHRHLIIDLISDVKAAAARRANALLRERGMEVWGEKHGPDADAFYGWRTSRRIPDTHRALLVCVSPIVETREGGENG